MLGCYYPSSSCRHDILHHLLHIRGLRERLLADPSFLIKLGIEVRGCACTNFRMNDQQTACLPTSLRGTDAPGKRILYVLPTIAKNLKQW